MSNEDIIEMVCDWAAMSQEFKNSLQNFIDAKVDKVYKFSNKQKTLINKVSEEFES